MFDSFSVFVEPISYQRIFHLVSVFYITAHLVNIILETQLTLISARRKGKERKGKERKGKERNFIEVSSRSSAGALIGDTVN